MFVHSAFMCGAPYIVKTLFALVCYYAGMHRVPHEVIKRQMEREYPGVSLDDVPLDWISYDEDELAEPDTELLESFQTLLRMGEGRS